MEDHSILVTLVLDESEVFVLHLVLHEGSFRSTRPPHRLPTRRVLVTGYPSPSASSPGKAETPPRTWDRTEGLVRGFAQEGVIDPANRVRFSAMPFSTATIRCIAVLPDAEGPFSLFIGRDDGVVEEHAAIEAVGRGPAARTLRGHRGPVTALLVLSAEALLSCSLDGTLREWRVGPSGGKAARTVDLMLPLHCMARQGERVYLGGADGGLRLVEGVRRSTWRGHRGALVCIAFAEDGRLFATGGDDHHVLVWDAGEGRPIRRLLGHANRVVGVAVVPRPALAGDDDDGNADDGPGDRAGPRLDGAIVSFARDGAMFVWPLPSPAEEFPEDPHEQPPPSPRNDASFLSDDTNPSEAKTTSRSTPKEEGDEGEEEEEEEEEEAHGDDVRGGGDADPFSEPGKGSPTPDHLVSDTKDSNKRVSFMRPAGESSKGGGQLPKVLPVVGGREEFNSIPSSDVANAIATSLTPKSALKPQEASLQALPLIQPIGMFGLPEIPLTLFQPPDPFVEEEGMGRAWSSMALVGTAKGNVWGLNLMGFTRDVLLFVRDCNRKAAAGALMARRTLRKYIALSKKSFRKQVLTKTNALIEAARKRRSEEMAASLPARRAQRRKDREQNKEQGGEEEEGEEEEDNLLDTNGEVELDMGYEEAEEEEEEEEAEEEMDGAEGRLRHLTDEEKAELEEFVKKQEEVRNTFIRSLQSSITSHLDKLSSSGRIPYTRRTDQFDKIRHTTVAKVGGEAVLAVVQGPRNVYAAQDGRVIATQLVRNLTNL